MTIFNYQMRLMIKISAGIEAESKSAGKGGGTFYLAGATSWLLIYDLFVWVARL